VSVEAAFGSRKKNADPDGDGMINLMEYFIGGNPLTAGFIKINPVMNGNMKDPIPLHPSRIPRKILELLAISMGIKSHC